MLSFELNEEELFLRNSVRKFVEKEIIPVSAELDELEKFPWDIIKKAFELGFLHAHIPKEFGGLGLSVVEQVIIAEEFGAGCLGVMAGIFAGMLGTTPILIGGNQEQLKKFIPPFIESPILASFCLTEPNAGSDAASISTQVLEDGDYLIINGSKMFITNAGVASIYTVFGTVDKKKGSKGTVCVVIPKDTPGISLGKPEKKLGQRCSDTRSITFENVKVSKENLIGKIGDGLKIAFSSLDRTRPIVAAGAVGAARSAMEHSIKYSKERKQFGKAICEFQMIQAMLADMASKIEAGRMLCYKAAWAIDKGDKSLANYYSSIAKRFCADMAMEIALDAVQIFGGYGYCKEYSVEKIMRDIKLAQIYEGTSQIQRLVIARHLLK